MSKTAGHKTKRAEIRKHRVAQTYYILYGFAEGPRVGRKLEAAMQQAGYTPAHSATEADILITHSGGCYFVPQTSRAMTIMLIGIPYWPGKSVLMCLWQKVRADFASSIPQHRFAERIRKSGWNVVYFFGSLRWCFELVRRRKSALPYTPPQARVILVRNKHDALCTPDIAETVKKKPGYSFRAMPDDHDDCWHNPERYVALIS
jgi:hypothetical protein